MAAARGLGRCAGFGVAAPPPILNIPPFVADGASVALPFTPAAKLMTGLAAAAKLKPPGVGAAAAGAAAAPKLKPPTEAAAAAAGAAVAPKLNAGAGAAAGVGAAVEAGLGAALPKPKTPFAAALLL